MSKPINNGGPAFPACNEANVNGTMGMTLRDWFAGNASDDDIEAHINWAFDDDPLGGMHPDCTREQAKYRYADAMLAAREETAKEERAAS